MASTIGRWFSRSGGKSKAPSVDETQGAMAALSIKGTGVGPESLTLGSILRVEKTNDPLRIFREHYKRNRASGELFYSPPADIPDRPCIDLSHTKLNRLPETFLRGLPTVDFLDLSSSEIELVPQSLCVCKIHILVLRGVKTKLLFNISRQIEQKLEADSNSERRDCFLRLRVKNLDVSGAPVGDNTEFIDSFRMLENLYMSGCELSSFPIDLYYRRSLVRHLDISHNAITSLPGRVYQYGCHNMFHEYDKQKCPFGAKLLPLSIGISEGIVHDSKVKGAYIGRPKEGQGSPFHCDLRGNPLDETTHRILEEFVRVRISDTHQIACLPGNFFIYCDLPKPPRFAKRI